MLMPAMNLGSFEPSRDAQNLCRSPSLTLTKRVIQSRPSLEIAVIRNLPASATFRSRELAGCTEQPIILLGLGGFPTNAQDLLHG